MVTRVHRNYPAPNPTSRSGALTRGAIAGRSFIPASINPSAQTIALVGKYMMAQIAAIVIGAGIQTWMQIHSFPVSHLIPSSLRSLSLSLPKVGTITNSIANIVTPQETPARRVLQSVVFDPPLEELVYRLGIQKLLIGGLQQMAIKLFSPNQPQLIDSLAARTMRIGLASLIFGLYHYEGSLCEAVKSELAAAGKESNKEQQELLDENGPYCRSQQAIIDLRIPSSFIQGLVYGTAYEETRSFWFPYGLHVFNNVLGRIYSTK